MALPSGVTRTDTTPTRAPPTAAPEATRPRLAPDRTRWCATCDTTLRVGSRETYCTECKRTRNTDSARASREQARAALQPVGLTVTSDALLNLLEANSVLQRKMAVASGESQPSNTQPKWLDELLLATKGVAVAVAQIEDQLPPRRRS
mgnify:CR=1 FL=1